MGTFGKPVKRAEQAPIRGGGLGIGPNMETIKHISSNRKKDGRYAGEYGIKVAELKKQQEALKKGRCRLCKEPAMPDHILCVAHDKTHMVVPPKAPPKKRHRMPYHRVNEDTTKPYESTNVTIFTEEDQRRLQDMEDSIRASTYEEKAGSVSARVIDLIYATLTRGWWDREVRHLKSHMLAKNETADDMEERTYDDIEEQDNRQTDEATVDETKTTTDKRKNPHRKVPYVDLPF